MENPQQDGRATSQQSSQTEPRRAEASGIAISALVLAILAPLVGLVLALIARSSARKAGLTPSGVATAALIVSGVLTGLGLVAAAVAILITVTALNQLSSGQLGSDQSSAQPWQSQTQVTLSIVSQGDASLDEGERLVVEEIVNDRLRLVGLTPDGVYFTEPGRVHVTFDETADEASIEEAVMALQADLDIEFRPVLAVGPCDTSTTGSGAAEEAQLCDEEQTTGFLLGPAEATGDGLADVRAFEITSSNDVSTGQWAVLLSFDSGGTSAIADLTTRLSTAAPPMNQLAITFDGQVLSAPVVNSAVTDGQLQISGDFDREGAESLARQFRFALEDVSFQVESATVLN